MRNSFEAERAKFAREVEGIAADLVRRGVCPPETALQRAREIVLDQRQRAAAKGASQ
jgi:hypothetical protein